MWRRKHTGHAPGIALSAHQLWMVSLCAPVNRGDESSRTTLYPFTARDDERARSWLAEQWELTTLAEVTDRLQDLMESGYRVRASDPEAQPLAWDVALYADVVRKAFASGLMDEPTAWHFLRATVVPVSGRYGSWTAFADDYLRGRLLWTDMLRARRGAEDEDFPAPQAVSDAHLRRLLDPANRASPWNLVPWDAVHRPDGPLGPHLWGPRGW
ncbi:DUF1266 domain-containing protein [Streptomyces sp. NPDC048172]|uniref:DUF1266 domain-containing protein n=1 Tax=Streptomyces sp. NPDC048172 TaxID=3365505 RepID=UPI0037153599